MFTTQIHLKVLAMMLLCGLLNACSQTPQQCSSAIITTWSSAHSQITQDITTLSSTEFQGRKTDSEGARLTQAYLITRFTEMGLQPWQPNFAVPFSFQHQFSTVSGVNIIATIAAKTRSNRWRVITAHYDHLGQTANKMYPGADDNASGIAGMMAIAAQWQENPPLDDVNLMIVATDAEEPGLYGSYALVTLLQQYPLMDIELSVNLDMIGHPDRRRAIYMEGQKNLSNFESIKPLLMQQTQLCIRTHHTNLLSGRMKKSDWLRASDHYPFHKAGYSWVYFGVPPHAQYHTADDTIATLDIDFIVAVAETVYQMLSIDKLTKAP
ncbi:M20/M25/M40 family metallo-hydrolase [Shewanella frigidimarina]|uniref:Peptidase M28 n=1 Tax=Shewanella frigidimarina (strain NCIMB 400) TaxID=318167 RepID=Q07WS4_SHEFN|nr:M20/M25/M40 family metallo-hydrolase [Shewanella frigidimarina]ABI73540.1 peptidase M28 [Shewanella frigidimarina NCIMB 400]HBF48138.1 peptidase M28 [Shewanella frigidimarina]|tara:strand:- start:71106 stop:72077 length:972 start_codon:yes stop_codon:yes gene_type:complete